MKIHKNKNTLVQMVNEKNILLNLDNGGFFELNEIGLEIWDAVSENTTVDQLIDLLFQKYQNECVKDDCLEFLEKLKDRKLISYSD